MHPLVWITILLWACVLLGKLCVWCYGAVELVQVQEKPDEAFNEWDETEEDCHVSCLPILLHWWGPHSYMLQDLFIVTYSWLMLKCLLPKSFLFLSSFCKVPWWKHWWSSSPSLGSPGWLGCWPSAPTPRSLHGSSSSSMGFRYGLQTGSWRLASCVYEFLWLGKMCQCFSLCRVHSSSSSMWWDMIRCGQN